MIKKRFLSKCHKLCSKMTHNCLWQQMCVLLSIRAAPQHSPFFPSWTWPSQTVSDGRCTTPSVHSVWPSVVEWSVSLQHMLDELDGSKRYGPQHSWPGVQKGEYRFREYRHLHLKCWQPIFVRSNATCTQNGPIAEIKFWDFGNTVFGWPRKDPSNDTSQWRCVYTWPLETWNTTSLKRNIWRT